MSVCKESETFTEADDTIPLQVIVNDDNHVSNRAKLSTV